MWDKAAVELKRYLELPTAKWPAERAAAMRWLAKAIPSEAEDWLKRAVQEDPGRRESLVDLAMHYYGNETWKDCYSYSTKALKILQKPLDYLCEEFAWGALPYDLAAISSYKLGSLKEALEYGAKAVELDPTNERLQRNLGFYQSE
jgi:tetratricopeptide (TPR) repeat protein